jgi:hypothetical protein
LVLGVLLATGVVMVQLGHRSGHTVAVNKKDDFGLCSKLSGEQAHSCYESEKGRELSAVGAVAGVAGIALAAPADARRIVTFTSNTIGYRPLLCALHTRIGVTSDDIPGWLSWSVPPVS